MGAAVSLAIYAQLATNVWSDLTSDTIAPAGLRLTYGIRGSGPLARMASSGSLDFVLNNAANNSGGVQGYYSPQHASVRTGWTFGIPIRVVFTDSADLAESVTSITRAGGTATVTTTAPHGYATNDYVTIAGATQTDYNGVFQITVTGGSTFTYTVLNAPATPATGTITTRKGYIKFRGTIRSITPDAGQYGRQQVAVTAYDYMRTLMEADARETTVQTAKTEAELLTSLIASLPTASQPVASRFDTGVDTYPIAFDNVAGGVSAGAVARDLTISAFGLLLARGDGTLRYHSRAAIATEVSQATFSNSMHGLFVPSSLDRAYNRVRVTIHPKAVSAAATDVLYTLPVLGSIAIAAGATIAVWTDYTDPNDRMTPVGGTAVVTALVAATHYGANAAADGSGLDLTASIVATLTAFSSVGLWSLTNNAGSTAYMQILKVIGKAVRDPGPQVYEATSVQNYGQRTIAVDMPYQNDANVGQAAADFVKSLYQTIVNQIDSMSFIASSSATLMTQALAREPGDRITITEPVTGITAAVALIQSVTIELSAGPWMTCTWGLAPVSALGVWQLGVAGWGELETATMLGF